MKLAISHDSHGNIVTMFDPAKLVGSDFRFEYVPGKDESHHVIDVPQEFAKLRFEEIPHALRVDSSGAKPKLTRKA